ncbi:hypothetical protein GCM10009665_07260 [Kitasatospora nipponensis]|uniref:Protein kinase domain-containing protein n=1 Tax=Kitasatospora nipponensis TaxID=258049 RepID=A0ABP4GE26_9ACTN
MAPEPLGPDDPRTAGPYELLALLGAGGMGRVYLARSGRGATARTVAVKVVGAEYARGHDYRPRFRAEVTAARAVAGPHLVPLLAADPEAEPPWLATEYVPGLALGELVARCGPLPEPAVRLLGAAVARALTALHATGLAHRDLTPSNVLVTPDGPWVIDFGLARIAGAPALTRTGAVLGTPGYMPPEQAAGFRAGPAGDVYALAAVLAPALAADPHGPPGGVRPAGGAGEREPEQERDRAWEPAEPTVLPGPLGRLVHPGPDLRAVPASLRPVLAEALSRDPADRPTARALGERLRATPGAVARADDDATDADAHADADARADAAAFARGWLPQAALVELAREVREADGYLRPPDRRRPWPTAPRSRTGAAGGRPHGAPPPPSTPPTPTPSTPLPPTSPTSPPPPSPPTPTRPLSRRGLLLGGAGVATGLAVGGVAVATALRRSDPVPPPQTLVPQWQVSHPDLEFVPAPDERLVLCTDGARLVALQQLTGVVQWSYPTAAAATGPQVAGRFCYVLAGGTIHCLNAADGSVNWTVSSVPTAEGPIVPDTLVAANDSAVYGGGPVPAAGLADRYAWFGLSVATRDVRWSFTEAIEATGRINTTASAYRGRTQTGALLFAESSGHVVVREPLNGAVLWSYPATAAPRRCSWFTPDTGQLYLPIGQDERTLQAISQADGSELWHRGPAGAADGAWTPAAVHRDQVLAADGEPRLSAFDSLDGTPLWELALPGPPSGARPLVVGDSLFLPGALGRLYRVDLARRRVDGVLAPDSRFGSGWQLARDEAFLYAAFGRSLYALPAPVGAPPPAPPPT